MNLKEKTKIMRNNRGITLIALVVTIIVLIILAGVSINLVLGDNGIVTKAKYAKTETEQAKLNEEVATNELLEQWDGLVGGTSTPIINPGESGYQGKNYDDPYIPEGFTHTAGTWNSGYTITDSLGNKFVWVPCVLDQSKVKNGDKVETFKKTLPTTTETTDPYYKYNQNNYTITGEESSASDIRESIGTYGGFYIAAYEAGIEGTTDNYSLTTKTATDGSVKPLSQPEKGVWNYISRTDAIKVAESMVNTSDGVKSGLISGEAWDTTLQWMVNTSDNASTNAGYDTNSTGKGWYNDVSSSIRHLTGYYAVNNIYDMAGNVFEWTTENCTYTGSSYLVIRGGSYGSSGSGNPAAYRNNDSDRATYGVGFRVLLYK